MVPGCEHRTSGAKVTSGRRSRQFFWLLGSPCSLSVRRSQPGLRRLSINYTSHPPIRGPRNGLLPQIQMSKMQSAFEGFPLSLAGRKRTNIKNASTHLPRDLKIKVSAGDVAQWQGAYLTCTDKTSIPSTIKHIHT